MIVYLLGCRGFFDSTAEIDTFLDEVTNKWWTLQEEGSNFYLEREGLSESGFLWLDYVLGPQCILNNNIEGGEWQYEPNDKFNIFYEDMDFQLGINEENDNSGCWKVNYGVLYTDIACPYTGDCNTVW